MDVKDLKVGYYYKHATEGVVKMDSKELQTLLDIGGEYDWSPVKITPKWAKIFKFEECAWRDGRAVDFYLEEEEKWFIHYKEGGGIEIGVGELVEIGLAMPHIKYVHQLQGLGLLLKGEELDNNI